MASLITRPENWVFLSESFVPLKSTAKVCVGPNHSCQGCKRANLYKLSLSFTPSFSSISISTRVAKRVDKHTFCASNESASKRTEPTVCFDTVAPSSVSSSTNKFSIPIEVSAINCKVKTLNS